MVAASSIEYHLVRYRVGTYASDNFDISEFTDYGASTSNINIRAGVGHANTLDFNLINPNNTLSIQPGSRIGVWAISVSKTGSNPDAASISIFQGYVINSRKSMDSGGIFSYNVHAGDRAQPLTQKYPSFNQYVVTKSGLGKIMTGSSAAVSGQSYPLDGDGNQPNGLLYQTNLTYSGPANVLPTASIIDKDDEWPTIDEAVYDAILHSPGGAVSEFPNSPNTTAVLKQSTFGAPVFMARVSSSEGGTGTVGVLWIKVENTSGTAIASSSYTFSAADAGAPNTAPTASITMSAYLTASQQYRIRHYASSSIGSDTIEVRLYRHSVNTEYLYALKHPATFSWDIETDYFNRRNIYDVARDMDKRLPGDFIFPYTGSTTSGNNPAVLEWLQDYTKSGAQFSVGTNVESFEVQEPLESTVRRIIMVPSDDRAAIYEYRDSSFTNFNAESTSAKTRIVQTPPFKSRQEAATWAYNLLNSAKERNNVVSFVIDGWTDTRSYIGATITLSVPSGSSAGNYIGKCTNEDHAIGADGVWHKTLHINGVAESNTRRFTEEMSFVSNNTKERSQIEGHSAEYIVMIPSEYGDR